MSLRHFSLWLLLGCALGVWWQHGQSHISCARPLLYRIGQVDERFGLSSQDFQNAVRQAEQVWETPFGSHLFGYDPTARLTINLVFDERQQTTMAGQRLVHRLEQTASSQATLVESYEYWHQVLNTKTREYEQAVADYHAQGERYQVDVHEWNAKGGAPAQVYTALENERLRLQERQQQLDSDRAYLHSLVETVSTLAERSRKLTTTYNRQVKTYQNLYGENRHFHKGEYDGKTITIYQFHDLNDLLLVLTHELGHALGVEHIKNPEAIMHDSIGEQDLDPVALTSDDIMALRSVCSER